MRKGQHMPLLLMIGSLILGISAIASVWFRDNTDWQAAESRLIKAEKFYERETERASEYAKQSKDEIESENLRYESLKLRIEAIEAKDRPMSVRLVDSRVEVDVKHKEKKLPVMKNILKPNVKRPRATQ